MSNTNVTSPGSLNKEQLLRHKLSDGAIPESIVESKILNGWGRRKQMKKLIEMVGLYRLQVHGVAPAKLARPLVNSVGYFLDAMKPEYRVRDKAPQILDEAAVIKHNVKV